MKNYQQSNDSVCDSSLEFSFANKRQTDKFIRLFLKKYPYGDNLYFEKKKEYDGGGKELTKYVITISDICWAHNIIKIGKLIKKCDLKEI